ncbi:MAG: PAS domain-containing protein, partial [Anaerolineae bacterium]
MNPFPSPLGAVAFTALLVSIMYLYVWWQYREAYLAAWSTAWAMHSLRYCFLLWITARPDAISPRLAYQLTDVAATLLLAWGSLAFLGIRPGRALLRIAAALLAIVAAWLVGAGVAGVAPNVVALPSRLLLGLVDVWLGIAMLRSRRLVGISSRAAGVAVIYVGTQRVVQATQWLALLSTSYGRFAYIVAEMVAAFGLFLAYFEKGRSELSRSEERFRRLTENAPDIIVRYRVARPRRCEYCSPAIADILGYRPEQVTQDPRLLLSLAHPDDRHLLLRALRHHESSRSGLLLRLVHA